MTDNVTKKSFRDAYGVLQQHAETLRDQSEPNIDDLLTIVTESVEAYKVCKERIDAVEAALKAALDGAGVAVSTTAAGSSSERTTEPPASSAPSATRATRSALPSAAPDPDDDDIPF
ncbi:MULTISPECIES: exodeoxyribonuclease VII small subunit [unclassified Variovorax]|uniref:exodeoxyribonuclease VII small subunit n=1 Tax=unclassified Variovorax TaxID=663243 RepID=UPI001BD67F6E|nr:MULTISPECIES: exodeoxyribonuclease VII small subunit [unclassified Variovorax]